MTAEIRDAFSRARARVEDMQRADFSSREIVRTHAQDVDAIVVGVFLDALTRCERPPAGIALVALGGYGRAELAPASDLDLMLLYRGWPTKDVTELNRAVVYPLWDSGRELGNRVREPRDVVRSFDRVDEVCALIDARLLAGDAGLFADLQSSVRRRLDRSRASFFKDLVRSTAERHRRYGHAGHLLEPNVRDSAGGLRDLHTLGWASKLLPGADGVDGLVASGQLSELDRELATAAEAFLLRLRIELHLLSGRHQDQLYLPEQDLLATRLGYGEDGRAAPADRMMQELYHHARDADAVVHSFWDRVLHTKRRRWRSPTAEPVGDGCVLVDGRLEVIAATNPDDDAAAWLRVFRMSIRRNAPVGRGSLNRLQEELAQSPVASWSAEAREVFFDILQSGDPAVRALEAMDTTRFLIALFGEWEQIRCLPQRDLYHRYTVDRHLVAASIELARSRSAEEVAVREAWSHVDDPQVLFLATLLHDVGKGRGGDHSEVGSDLAYAAALRIGLDDARASDVRLLVREHLTLVSTATRRDLNDPRTLDEVIRRVGDLRRLSMLFLLTRADSLATGAEAWSSFRASLVRELYGRVAERLGGAPGVPTDMSHRLSELASSLGLDGDETERLLGPMPEAWLNGLDLGSAARQLAVLRDALQPGEVGTSINRSAEADELVVVAPDRPGLFATVAGVLALRGIDVHAADVYTRSDGIAVEVFRVRGAHEPVSEDKWQQVRDDIRSALDGGLDLDAALGRKAAQTRRRRTARRRGEPVRIEIDNDASATHTIVEIHAEDRLGLLREITKALTDAGCDLSIAKIATFGVEVIDVFYVRDLEGRKITDPAEVARLRHHLGKALHAADGPIRSD